MNISASSVLTWKHFLFLKHFFTFLNIVLLFVPITIFLLFIKSFDADLSLRSSGTEHIFNDLNFFIIFEVKPISTVDAIDIIPLYLWLSNFFITDSTILVSQPPFFKLGEGTQINITSELIILLKEYLPLISYGIILCFQALKPFL